MLNRVLIQLTNPDEAEFLSKFTRVLNEKYPRMEVTGLYVKNLDEYMRYNSALFSDAYYQDFMSTWKQIEEKKEGEVRDAFERFFPDTAFLSYNGYSDVVAMNELRMFDMLILAKQSYITREVKALLSSLYKPIMIIPERDTYKLDNILFADDERPESNRAFFSFMTLFDRIASFKALGVNIEKETFRDLNDYLKKTGKSISYHFREGHADELILEYARDFDCLIMGDLKHSFLVERLGGKVGLKILERTEIPLFIG